MYVPAQFREERRDVLVAAMREIQFAALVTAGEDGICATHVPVVLREMGGDLVAETHVARANNHWRASARPTMAIFQGPHAYVHPGWYASKGEHGKVVPTWTYVVVHAHGTLEAFQDRDELIAHVTQLTSQNEAARQMPWAVADAPETYITAMTRGIVGLRFKVDRLEGSWKLNQHKSEADRKGVIAGLSADGGQHTLSVAELMRAGNDDRAPTSKGMEA